MVVGSSVPQSPQPSNLGVYNTLPHILSLPPLSVPGFITKFPNHPTPPPSLSPSSLPSPGKAICSPIKVPTPPASSFSLKRSSLTSLAQYLSNVSPVSLSSLSPPLEPKRRKLSPNKTNPSSLPPSSPPHSSSGEERNSPEGDADSDTEGLVIEETRDDEHARLLNSVFPSNQSRHINATQDGEPIYNIFFCKTNPTFLWSHCIIILFKVRIQGPMMGSTIWPGMDLTMVRWFILLEFTQSIL